jgi:hypothetical protein
MITVPLSELARREVIALHEFFVRWFTSGEGADFASCERAFAPDFAMVTPEGKLHGRDAIVAMLRDARGALSPGFAITILDPHPVWTDGDAVLLGYVEQQYRDGRVTRRRSTALFTRDASAPRGVVWRYLQETWMDAGEKERD